MLRKTTGKALCGIKSFLSYSRGRILTLKGLREDLLAPLKSLRIKRLYDRLFSSFKSFLCSWENFKAVRSVIEDLFKVLKNSLSLKNLHRYSNRSVAKFAALCVLLLGMLVSKDFNTKEKLQALLCLDSARGL